MFSVIENSLNLDAVNLDALYLVKLIFGEYFCYFDSHRVAFLLQLQLYLDANRVPVHERFNLLPFQLPSSAKLFPSVAGATGGVEAASLNRCRLIEPGTVPLCLEENPPVMCMCMLLLMVGLS